MQVKNSFATIVNGLPVFSFRIMVYYLLQYVSIIHKMRKPRMTKLGQGVVVRAHYPTPWFYWFRWGGGGSIQVHLPGLHLLEQVHKYQKIQENTRKYLKIAENIWKYQKISENTRNLPEIYQKLTRKDQKIARKCQKITRNTKKLSENYQKYQKVTKKLPKNYQKITDQSWPDPIKSYQIN